MSVVSDASKTCLNFNKSIEIPVTHKKMRFGCDLDATMGNSYTSRHK